MRHLRDGENEHDTMAIISTVLLCPYKLFCSCLGFNRIIHNLVFTAAPTVLQNFFAKQLWSLSMALVLESKLQFKALLRELLFFLWRREEVLHFLCLYCKMSTVKDPMNCVHLIFFPVLRWCKGILCATSLLIWVRVLCVGVCQQGSLRFVPSSLRYFFFIGL